MRILLAGLLAAACATGAHAQVLASADNGTTQTYTTSSQFAYLLDGTNTTLTFKTTKANEVVQFSFNAAYCGVKQTGTQSANQLSYSGVEAFFLLDGTELQPPTGANYNLCSYDIMPQAVNMAQAGSGLVEQRVTVPGAGTHTFSVTAVVVADGQVTQVYPALGMTHAEVRK